MTLPVFASSRIAEPVPVIAQAPAMFRPAAGNAVRARPALEDDEFREAGVDFFFVAAGATGTRRRKSRKVKGE